MHQDAWLTFLRRMVDAKKHFQFQAYKTIPLILPYMILLYMDLCLFDKPEEDCNANEEPPLWWIVSVLALPVPMYFILKKIGEGPTNEYRDTQEKASVHADSWPLLSNSLPLFFADGNLHSFVSCRWWLCLRMLN